MAVFFDLPIARRIADDPPSFEAFYRALLIRYPLDYVQDNFLDRMTYTQRMRRRYGVEYDQSLMSKQDSDELMTRILVRLSTDGYIKPILRFYATVSGFSYDTCISQLETFVDQYEVLDEEDARDFLRDHYNVRTCNGCTDDFCDDDLNRVYDDYYCVPCTDRHFVWSEYHDEYIGRDDAVRALDRHGDRVWIDTNLTDDFEYDEDSDDWYHIDFDRPNNRRVIRSYHSSKDEIQFQHDDWTRKYRRFFGVELEVESERGERQENAAAIDGYVNNDGTRRLFFESDGSLTCGFEIITQPMSLPAVREAFKFLQIKELTRNLKSHNTTTCGLHVHVSRDGMTDLQIGKIVSFINDPKHESFIRGLARRYATGYSRVKEKTVKDCRSGDRYEAVNLTNRKTIEFRIFKGSLKYEAVIAAVEFCNALVEFTKPSISGIRDLNINKFIFFCNNQMRGDTKILRNYLNDRMSGQLDLSEAA